MKRCSTPALTPWIPGDTFLMTSSWIRWHPLPREARLKVVCQGILGVYSTGGERTLEGSPRWLGDLPMEGQHQKRKPSERTARRTQVGSE